MKTYTKHYHEATVRQEGSHYYVACACGFVSISTSTYVTALGWMGNHIDTFTKRMLEYAIHNA